MRAVAYVYDSADPPDHVETVLERLADREEAVDELDVDAADDRADARREAMLTVKRGVGIGSPPDALYDEDGRPDFSPGVLVTEAATGRRSLHVGRDALDALREDG